MKLSLTTLGLIACLLPAAVQGGVRGTKDHHPEEQVVDKKAEDRNLIEVTATEVKPKSTVIDIPETKQTSVFGNGNIVGGTLATRGEFPWFVAPEASDSAQYCGGSLIHADTVLTAASCARQFQVGKKVYIGAYQPNSAAYGAQTRTVAKIIMHPQYNQQTYMNDFMLVILSSPVTGVTPVTLNAQAATPSLGQELELMGFGWVNQQTGVTPSLLVKVNLSQVAQNVCQSQYNKFILADGSSLVVNPQTMMCGGAVGGGVGPCVGDVGSPLVTAGGVQVGIVSFGVGCGSVNYSSIYSRVSGAKSWIDQTVCKESNAKPANCGGGANSKQVIMVMNYDAMPLETTFDLKQGNTVLYRGPGSTNSPGPNQVWHYDFGYLPEGVYELLVKDSACNGQLQLRGTGNVPLPRFEVFESWADTAASSLGQGPLNNMFGCEHSLFFSVGDQQVGSDERCDNPRVGSGLTTQHCEWLTQLGGLCNSYDISLKCPVTCNRCQDLTTWNGKVNGQNRVTPIPMGPTFNSPRQTCSALANNPDKNALCKRYSIALHCQSTCGVTPTSILNPVLV